ncbi:NCS1 family transporter [Marinomonas foliarum]|uniref:NCS1 family transporter n=1 Tax=Marinomonas foliarum TaxID=491950 RepID=A0ABX7IM54_9GAMM|nr:NCS1 family transporter [Marinomonas foliarum]QRV23390.1 NCS1 family transporter [Marinomonas foliarum]|tara:strand:- start:5942 stop:7390 length:1449 start_codon:yes stop_codon:yes gene_type:complete
MGSDTRVQNLENNPLFEESLAPITQSKRTIGVLGYCWIWVGIAVMIATFQLGANGVQGLSLMTVVLTIFFANVGLAVFMTLTADIGTEHGLSFAVYLRAPFGTVGTHFPAISRALVATMWFGIQTYLGALALNGIVEYLTGFNNWIVWYALFALLQLVNTALGIKAVERVAAIAAPAILAISVWMYYTLEGVADMNGINIWTFQGMSEISLITLFIANMGFWSTMAIDVPNLTRFVKTRTGTKKFFKRNKSVLLAQLLALPLTQAWVAMIGAVSFIATGDWNPVNVIQGQGEGISMVILLLLVVLAQWSTNNSANLIPAAMIFINVAPKVLNYKVAVCLAGIVGTLCMPWELLNNLFTFLFYYGAFLSSIGGIMVADYYLIRNRKINVPELFKVHGQYRYFNGFNLAGLISWIISGGIASYFVQYSFVIGFPLGLIIYFFSMKFIVMKIYDQPETRDNCDDLYLATSIGKDWIIEGEEIKQS